MSEVNTVDEKDFRNEVLDARVPVLVDFSASWCGPCRALAPMLDEIALAYAGRLKVVKVDVDEAPHLAGEYRIRGVPTLMLFKDGEVADMMVGLQSSSVLRQKIDAAVARPTHKACCCCA